MLSDAVVSVRCPGCGEVLDPTCLKAVLGEGPEVSEHYSCGCGCRFVVTVSVVRRPWEPGGSSRV